MLSTHDQHQIVYVHERSGMSAICNRNALLNSPAPSDLRALWTGFVSTHEARVNLRAGARFPNGEVIVDPAPELARWRDEVIATLDAYTALDTTTRYFADLQAMWRGPEETL